MGGTSRFQNCAIERACVVRFVIDGDLLPAVPVIQKHFFMDIVSNGSQEPASKTGIALLEGAPQKD